MKSIANADLLILDDLGLAPMSPEQLRDLLEIIDERPSLRARSNSCMSVGSL
jgi:DNA replication protein DnaC